MASNSALKRKMESDIGEFLQSLGGLSSLSSGLLGRAVEEASGKQSKSVTVPPIKIDGSPESKKNLMLLKEMARALTEQSKYYEASSVLEIFEDHEEEHDLSTKLVIGECYLSLGREAKASRRIEEVRKFLMDKPAPDAAEAFEMIESLVEAKSYLRALILLPVAAHLYENVPNREDAAEGMFRCIKKANDCARPMISEGGRSRVLAVDYGLEFMEDCLKDLLKIERIDKQKLAHKHCQVSSWTGYIYGDLHENSKSLRVRQKAIKHMDEAFPAGTAKQRRIYGNTLYNMGVAYAIQNKNEQARAAYLKAIEATEHATDFDSDADRQKELKMYRQKLKDLN